MKKLIILSLLAFIAITMNSCVTPQGTLFSYSYKLIPDSINLSKDTISNTFKDNKISASFSISSSQLAFTINNLTNDGLKINWDEASLVQEGKAKRVIHNGIKLIDRNAPQAPSVIPPKMSYSDFVIPSENIYYRQGTYSAYYSSPGGWEELPLYPIWDLNNESTRNVIMSNKGKEVLLYLPIECNGLKTNYMFKFRVANVSPVKSSH